MKWSGFRIEKVIFTVLFSRVKEQTILTVVEKCFYPKLPRSNKLLNRNIRHKAIILTSPLEITPSPKSRADEGGRKFRLRLTQFPKIRDDENRVPFLSVSLTSAGEGTSKARKMQRQFLLPREHSVLWIQKMLCPDTVVSTWLWQHIDGKRLKTGLEFFPFHVIRRIYFYLPFTNIRPVGAQNCASRLHLQYERKLV